MADDRWQALLRWGGASALEPYRPSPAHPLPSPVRARRGVAVVRLVAAGVAGGLVATAVAAAAFLLARGDGPAPAPMGSSLCDDAPPAVFDDVDVNDAHGRSVHCLREVGVLAGIDAFTYDPEGYLTVGQGATVATRVLRIGGWDGPLPTRVSDAVHDEAIHALIDLDVLREGADPASSMTRAQFAVSLDRLRTLLLGPLEPAIADWFTDVAASPERISINRLAAHEVLTGYSDGTFRPDLPVTRDQAASMLDRLLVSLVRDGLTFSAS